MIVVQNLPVEFISVENIQIFVPDRPNQKYIFL